MKYHHAMQRLFALLLVAAFCMGLMPAAFAEQVLYRDPAEHWKKAANRTNELDVNSVATTETFFCPICQKPTAFTVWRAPEYTRDGQTALSRNVKYSDGMMLGGQTMGTILDGVPNVDSTYTGYHWTKACCNTCGTLNANAGASDYSCGKNIYWLYDCDANFIEYLDEDVAYEYVDSSYHMVTTDGGTYCAFCYGTKHTHDSQLEAHDLRTEVIPQLGHQRFAIRRYCARCEYEAYDYVAAKSVIANYFGEVDGQPHTISVANLSEDGVTTVIRYGNTADRCTMNSAPNYTDAGQYIVYYEISYSFQGQSMTEDGAAYVWLHEASETGSDSAGNPGSSSSSGGNGAAVCGCGCGEINCSCQSAGGGNTGGGSGGGSGTGGGGASCGSSCPHHVHNWTLSENIAPTCSLIGYDRYICVGCGATEKRDYVSATGHDYKSVIVRDADCTTEGMTMELCSNCGDAKVTTTPKGTHQYKSTRVDPTCTGPGYTVQECSVCGERHIEAITQPTGHRYTSYVSEPTCTTGGHTMHVCSDCHELYIDSYTPAKGHNMDRGTVLTAGVCGHEGIKQYTCRDCGYIELEAISATGHTPGPAAILTKVKV